MNPINTMLYWRGGELQRSGFTQRVDRKHKKWKHKKIICSVQDVNGLGKKEKKKDRERKNSGVNMKEQLDYAAIGVTGKMKKYLCKYETPFRD